MIGVAAIAAIAAYLGITASLKLSKRADELRIILLMIDKIKTCLAFEKAHTKDIIAKLCSQSEFSKLCFLNDCRNILSENSDISRAWKCSVENSSKQLHLEKSDLSLLISIGNILGSADSKSQTDELNLLAGFLNKNLESALTAYNTQGRLYRSLGVLSGIGIAIVLI